MVVTAQVRLDTTGEQSEVLRATLGRFNAAASWVGECAVRDGLFRQFDLHRAFYREIRGRFGLSAQMAVRAIGVVAAALARNRTVAPSFRDEAAVPYDARILSFKADSSVSILTLDGRIVVPYLCGARQRALLEGGVGECDLVRRKGRWYLYCSVEIEERGSPLPRQFLGVDLGVVNLATTSDGTVYTGTAVERIRRRYAEKRRRLQVAAAERVSAGARPKNVRRKLKKFSKKEALFRRDVNHCISKKLVKLAEGTQRGISLEHLTGIRSRTRFRKSQRARMNAWSFAQLRSFIEYKATLAGVLTIAVNPRNSSRQCSQCRHVDKANRRMQAEFACKRCAYVAHADVNAAKNLAYRAEVSLPIVSMLVLMHKYSGTSSGLQAGVA